ncbi:hypothetical protein AAFG13_36765 [Bradyrhizobium sp. B124]|uniref:DUF4172 domain-containing protein n=1 Tax=Bradyrhizobium sp. B124 TaxID=3140245 RepID=UPI003183055C
MERPAQSQATLQILTEEVVKSSEGGGEVLNRDQIPDHPLPADFAWILGPGRRRTSMWKARWK